MKTYSYAHDLLDDLDPYLGNNKWFKLLRLRLYEQPQNKTAQKIVGQILEEHLNDQDLDYNLELLSILAEIGDPVTFRLIVKRTLPLIKREEDFQDLLAIAIDYFHRLDQDQQELTLKTLLEKRTSQALDKAIAPQDPDFIALIQLFNLKRA